MLRDLPDEDLMVAYQLGDENAFRELYERHSARVYGFIRSKIQNEALALDIFQAFFLKLHKSRKRYDPAFPFVPWLFTVCRSTLIDFLREQKRNKEDATDNIPEPVQELPNDPDAICLTNLNEPQRKAVEMRYHHEFSFEEMAHRLETSPANARQILSRAIKNLRGTYAKK